MFEWPIRFATAPLRGAAASLGRPASLLPNPENLVFAESFAFSLLTGAVHAWTCG